MFALCGERRRTGAYRQHAAVKRYSPKTGLLLPEISGNYPLSTEQLHDKADMIAAVSFN